MSSVIDRFLKYVSFDTQSNEDSETCPSTDKQRVLGAALVEEMLAMGIADAHRDAGRAEAAAVAFFRAAASNCG